ncbi:MAG: hypothetical protein JSU05_05595, partial [Bacteroidetes bacterium]|nr:hypothetical protein [Bacteroidota bacterium]
ASMQSLHQAQFGRNGYVQNLSEIKKLIDFLLMNNKKKNIADQAINSLAPELKQRLFYAADAFKNATGGLTKAKDATGFYYDYIYLPSLMYYQLLDFENTLLMAVQIKQSNNGGYREEDLGKIKQIMAKAFDQLKEIYQTCMKGDKNEKWATWYDPAKRRPNNGFPTLEMIQTIQSNLNGGKGN